MGGNVRINNISSEYKPSKDKSGTAINDRSLSVTSAAALIAAPLASGTTHIHLDVQDADIYYTLDGSDPVATTNGHLWAAGKSAIWNRDLAEDVRVASAGTARIHISELQTI